MFTLARDRDGDQDPLSPIVPVPGPGADPVPMNEPQLLVNVLQRRVQRHPTPEAPLIKYFMNPSHILFLNLQTVCWGLASVLGVRAMSQGSIVLLTLAFAMQIVFLLIAQYTVLSHINPGVGNWVEITGMDLTLLAMIALLSVQSSTHTLIHYFVH